MDFKCYGKDHKKFHTDKLSELKKAHEVYELEFVFEDGDKKYVNCDLRPYRPKDLEDANRHNKLVDFLKGFYGCDVVFVRHLEETDDYWCPYDITFGFYVVKNDVVEKFISDEYANGLFDGVMSCKE